MLACLPLSNVDLQISSLQDVSSERYSTADLFVICPVWKPRILSIYHPHFGVNHFEPVTY